MRALIALALLALSAPAFADEIIISNQNYSVVKTTSPSGGTTYLWRTKDGDAGTASTVKDAKKAAKNALND